MNESIPRPGSLSGRPARPVLRSLLWALLVLGAVGNMVASAASAGMGAHLVLGAVTAAAATGLLVEWSRSRA